MLSSFIYRKINDLVVQDNNLVLDLMTAGNVVILYQNPRKVFLILGCKLKKSEVEIVINNVY